MTRFKRHFAWIFLAAAVLCGQEKPVEKAVDKAVESPLAAVDEIFQQVSKISGIPIKHKVQSEVVSRERIREYIVERMKETTTAAEIHAQEAAYVKFGLLPAGFQLEKFIVDLLTEQATAFYDPKQKKFFLSDWAPGDIQKPAIAHELCHALQDQAIELNDYMEAKGMSQDEQMARKAVVEGEAVLAMMEYMMAPMGMHVLDFPDLSKQVNEATKSETAKFPIFSAAPPYLREGLLFPYTQGLTYTQAKSKGIGKAVYELLLKNPPHSTHEVMHPDAPSTVALKLEAPTPPAAAIAGYKKLDSNVLGELDFFVLIREQVDESTARAVTPAWRASRYDVYENAGGQVILAHRTKLKDAESAGAFADAYRKVIAKKGGEAESRVEVHGDLVDVLEGLSVKKQ